MASYADTLCTMMTNYPSLFIEEYDVLHHLFFVNGNGYRWQNGELVNPFPEPFEIIRDRNVQYLDSNIKRREEDDQYSLELLKNRNLAVDSPEGKMIFEGRFEHTERLKEERKLWLAEPFDPLPLQLLAVEDRIMMSGYSEAARKLYPICQYAKICNIPNDIKPDWVTAARSAHKMALSGYYQTTEEDREWLFRIGTLILSRY